MSSHDVVRANAISWISSIVSASSCVAIAACIVLIASDNSMYLLLLLSCTAFFCCGPGGLLVLLKVICWPALILTLTLQFCLTNNTTSGLPPQLEQFRSFHKRLMSALRHTSGIPRGPNASFRDSEICLSE